MFAAAVVSPIVNTGLFIVGVYVFFNDTLVSWTNGTAMLPFIIFTLVGFNFLVELTLNIVLSSVIERIINYRVTVLGAVRNPGVVQNTTGERMTILEILGKVGDLTNVAFRKNVRVIREQDGRRISYTIDLTNPDSVFNSPAYFVKQNDLIYVEANKSERVKGSTGYTYLSVVGSFVSIVASVASLIISLTR